MKFDSTPTIVEGTLRAKKSRLLVSFVKNPVVISLYGYWFQFSGSSASKSMLNASRNQNNQIDLIRLKLDKDRCKNNRL